MTTASLNSPPGLTSSRLTPIFRIELRRRHAEDAPTEIVEIQARTIASARHAARLAYPDTVILSVARV